MEKQQHEGRSGNSRENRRGESDASRGGGENGTFGGVVGEGTSSDREKTLSGEAGGRNVVVETESVAAWAGVLGHHNIGNVQVERRRVHVAERIGHRVVEDDAVGDGERRCQLAGEVHELCR